ncbi:acyltransferase [Erwinia billingiae]|uniref:acyltransferase family protein n=1 Tax=Erwinia billingiae TaxID=182337 RepID=UPI0030CE5FBF
MIPNNKIKYLDGIRGILSVMVALHHAFGNFTGWSSHVYPIKNAVYAVDIFFMLSGIVLYHNYHHSIKNKKFSLKSFFVVRMFRLYPMHIFTSLLVPAFFTMSISAFYPEWIGNVTPFNLFGDFTLLSSLGLGFHLLTNGPSWSISVELFVGTIITFLCCRYNKAPIVFISIALILSLIVKFDVTGINLPNIPLMTSGIIRCVFCMSAGILCYQWVLNSSHQFSKYSSLISFSGTTLIIITIFFLKLPLFEYFAISFFSALSVNLFTKETLPALKILDVGVFKWLGQRSFSIYLLHTPVIFLMIRMQNNDMSHNIYLAISSLGITLMLSEFSFNYIEKPFIKFSKKFKS